jgi:hypothetical protein
MSSLFGWENHARSAIITASAALPGLGPGQLQNDHGATSTSWQTPAGTTSAWLLVDAGAALSWRALGVFNTNLTTAATLRWRLGNDPGFATALQDSGTLSGTIAAGFRQGLHILPSAVTARYLRLDIADPANPEGALRVAQLYAGTAVAALRSISRQSAFLRIADAPSLTTRGGQEFPLLRHARRAWQVSLPALAQSEVWPLVHALQQAAEDGRNILFVPFPAGPDSAREAVFGRLLAPSAITWPGPGLRSWSATITERL